MGGGGATTNRGAARQGTGMAAQVQPMPDDIFGKSATAYGGALDAATAAGTYAAQGGTGTYRPRTINPQTEAFRTMGNYTNPWTQDVINAATNDIDAERRRQLAGNAADAASAGAFGGGRHGVIDANTNEAALDTLARTTAGLRSEGFNTAAGLAGQDLTRGIGVDQSNQDAVNRARQFNAGNEFERLRHVLASSQQLSNLAGQGFDFGRMIQSDQSQQGKAISDKQEDILTQALLMNDQYLNQPADILNTRLASLGLNPGVSKGTKSGYSNTQTKTSSSPGIGDIIGGFSSLLGGKG